MSKIWTEQLIDDVLELDNQCYNLMPLSIIIRTDLNDDGKRYFDAAVYTGHTENEGKHLGDVIGSESLSELFNELARALNK